MHFTYRGIRYEAQSSSIGHSHTEPRGTFLEHQSSLPSLPPTVKLKYRGAEYVSLVQKSNSSISDPDLESFIAAFWAIVDA